MPWWDQDPAQVKRKTAGEIHKREMALLDNWERCRAIEFAAREALKQNREATLFVALVSEAEAMGYVVDQSESGYIVQDKNHVNLLKPMAVMVDTEDGWRVYPTDEVIRRA